MKVYHVTRFGRPELDPRPELGETIPQHEDMLRYDLAFCNPSPGCHHEVIFPIFRHSKTGTSMQRITIGRWESFSMRVQNAPEDANRRLLFEADVRKWITYRHPEGRYDELVPVTLEQYLASEKGLKIAGWR